MAQITLEPEVIDIPEPDISHIETEDDTPVDNIFSEKQQRLLTESLYTSWRGHPTKDRPFVALANVGLFFAIDEPALVPDMLLSLDAHLPEELWEKKHRSYFIWEYGKPPEVVVEVVSNRKGGELGKKKKRYAQIGIAYYVVFDPARQLGNKVVYLFERRGGEYVEVRKLWLPAVGLGLTVWNGEYEGQLEDWLRWCDREGNLIATGAEATQQAYWQIAQERERAEQERERADQERERAEQERERAERLAAQLRALGIEPAG